MSSSLEDLIELGNDITAFKYYAVAMITVLFWEYIILLPDEINYAWSSNRSSTFYLFLLNRYFPLAFLIWMLVVSVQPNLTQEMCNKSSFASMFSFVVCTLLAQTVLTLRIHAMAEKNWLVTSYFVAISLGQLALGIYLTCSMVSHPAESLSTGIPYGAFKTCVFTRNRTAEVAYTSISLGYDFIAFVVVVYLASRSKLRGHGLSSIMDILVRDATKYFLLIFTSHLVLAMTLLFARPSIQLTPTTGNVVYLPVMIARLMISLKKASLSSGSTEWSMGVSTLEQANLGLRFNQRGLHDPEGEPAPVDDIPLSRVPIPNEKADC